MTKKNDTAYFAFTIFFAIFVILVLQGITGQWFFESQPYNSYILQAKAWLDGQLDLGTNYEYLELAIFNGKYFVSFPPFPSYVMLPFVALGWDSCDGFIALMFSIGGVVFSYKAAKKLTDNNFIASVFSLLATICSNWLFTSLNAWVWFIAQNMAFTLTMAAFYYALCKKSTISLFLWSCAVGCRPFQIIYIIVIFFILYKGYKQDGETLKSMIKKHIISVIPMCIVAVSYMTLNYARFGSIFEFGHNYLPEFMRVDTGQFNMAYIKQNVKNLFRLPQIINGKISFYDYDGFCIFIASPVFTSFVGYLLSAIFKGEKKDKAFAVASLIIVIAHLIAITAHKTMGGSHYGNRYTNDILPFVFLVCVYMCNKYQKAKEANILPLTMGFVLNSIWITMYY